MASYYRNQPTRAALVDVSLTSDFNDNSHVFSSGGFTEVSIDIDYERGVGEVDSSLELKLEHSMDGGDTWYSLVIDNTVDTSVVTPRVWRVVEGGRVNVLVQIAYKLMRVSVRETGVSSAAGKTTVFYTPSGL